MTERVVHVLDEAGPAGHPAALAAAIGRIDQDRAAGCEVATVLLGGRRLQAEAAALSLSAARTVAVGVPGGRAWRNPAAISRALRRACDTLGQPADRLHAWSVDALAAAEIVRPRIRKTLTLLHSPTPEQKGHPSKRLRWLRRLSRLNRTGLTIETPWRSVAGRLLNAGLDAKRITVTAAIAPTQQPTPLDRPQLRDRWGLDTPAEDRITRVIALLGDPPTAANASTATMVAGLARESLRSQPDTPADELILLTHPSQRHGPRARFNLAHLGRADMLAQEPALDRPWTVLVGCDAVLALGEAPLALQWARRADLPVVAESHPLNAEALAGDNRAVLVPPETPKRAAHALTQALKAAPVAVERAASA
jgi:hypothetical protein